jgi:hypothetical protein
MSTIASEEVAMRRRLFFVTMAVAVVATVFIGFAPTFYLRGHFTQTRPMSVLLHVHGIVFSAWVGVFFVQTLLIARGSRRMHQRLGWVAVGIAATMIVLVVAAVLEQLRRVRGFPPPPLALALSAFDISVFMILVGTWNLLPKTSRLAQTLRPVSHNRIARSPRVPRGDPLHRLAQHGYGRDCFGSARGRLFSAVLCS